jgi:hypothetical protein
MVLLGRGHDQLDRRSAWWVMIFFSRMRSGGCRMFPPAP